MPKLSVIVPTYNEESYLEDALFSVAFADEIIVVDSYSTDSTPEIAKKYAHKFLQRKFDNFSDQKNFALKEATGDWILFLDADERVTHSLEAEILETIQNQKHADSINFPHFHLNRVLYAHRDDVLRLVQRDGPYSEGSVHEKLHCSGSVGKLNNIMLHYTYKGLSNYIKKKESYAWFQAENLFEKNKKTTWFHLIFKPSYRFFSSYILKGGFRDGVPGLTVAAVNAYGVFQRYAKLLLLHKGIR